MMLKKFNDFRTACIDEFKQAKQTRSMHCDLDKLLAIQGILRLGKKTSPLVAAAFGEESIAGFWKKMKKEKFGEVKSMTESTRKQLEDALEDFDDDDNDEEMERMLLQLQLNSSSDESRVVKVLLSMFQHMTEEKEAVDEMRLQSGVVSSFCQLFKLSRKHDIFGCNKILFSELSALKDCRPDFAVKVQANNTIINSIGEIKGTKSCPESVALDTYRLGIFGMNMLWKYQLKNSMVFHVHGQEMVLWMCTIHQGICLMIEVERILLPTTYLEFVDLKGKLNKLYNLSLLYKNYCVEEESKAKPWQLLRYEAVKALYGLVTTASKASTAKDSTIPKASSSTEVGL
ncbi:hypothetical protein EDC96DRAFT_530294 [Choanephora cucurbitarum]|nr:hypothetical protein EDC96DRAFT_530294 [Choanephora cucurbitarum]